MTTRQSSSGSISLPGLVPGQKIAGRYVVIAHLGSGGMGDVYEVEHALLGKRFAIKRLPVDSARDTAIVERFLREARAAAATGHPGVVDVSDVGFAEDGMPYLVMELLEGETLRRRLDRGALDEPTLLRVARAVLDALIAVHGASIIHRDLKPENLFLCRDGRLVVLDFGLSHDTELDVRLTQSGAVMGTPLYMAPEQARGDDVDERTDLYALGAVLYECACARPPFSSPAYSALVAMILEAEADRERLGHLSTPVRDCIMAALSKKPGQRPRSATEMMARLGAEIAEAPSWGAIPPPAPRVSVSMPTMASGLDLPAGAEPSIEVELASAVRPSSSEPADRRASETRAMRKQNAPSSVSAEEPEAPAPGPTPAPTAAPTATSAPSKRTWINVAAIAVIGGGLVVGALVLGRSPSSPSPARKKPPRDPMPPTTGVADGTTVPPAEVVFPLMVSGSRRLSLDDGCEEYPRFSPDGKRIVFDGVVGDDYEVMSMPLDGGARTVLTHTDGWDYAAATSPDGTRVAYVHDSVEGRTLRVIGAEGDQTSPTRDLGPTAGYPSWTSDGALLVGDTSGRILRWELSPHPESAVTRETVLGQLPAGARPYHLAEIEGKGIAILWWTSTEVDATALGELDLDGTLRVIEEATTDYEGGLTPGSTPGSYYVTREGATIGNQLWWRRWGGDAPQAVPGGLSPRAGVDVSATGREMVFSTCKQKDYVALLRKGAAPEVLSRGDWNDSSPFNIDATRMLINSDRMGKQQGWLVDRKTGDARAVTPADSHGASPSFDGRLVVYVADGGRGGIAVVDVDGGTTRKLTTDGSDSWPALTRDGKYVVFARTGTAGQSQLQRVAVDSGVARALVAGTMPATSPVSDTIAFVTAADATGARRVMLTDLEGALPRSVPGLDPASWQQLRFSSDGKHLLGVRGYREVVDITVDGSAPPRVLWTATTESVVCADWAPDGKGVIAALGEYIGDIWIAEGTFR